MLKIQISHDVLHIAVWQAEDEGKTRPLHEAVTYDHFNVVKILLDHGADVSTR